MWSSRRRGLQRLACVKLRGIDLSDLTRADFAQVRDALLASGCTGASVAAFRGCVLLVARVFGCEDGIGSLDLEGCLPESLLGAIVRNRPSYDHLADRLALSADCHFPTYEGNSSRLRITLKLHLPPEDGAAANLLADPATRLLPLVSSGQLGAIPCQLEACRRLLDSQVELDVSIPCPTGLDVLTLMIGVREEEMEEEDQAAGHAVAVLPVEVMLPLLSAAGSSELQGALKYEEEREDLAYDLGLLLLAVLQPSGNEAPPSAGCIGAEEVASISRELARLARNHHLPHLDRLLQETVLPFLEGAAAPVSEKPPISLKTGFERGPLLLRYRDADTERRYLSFYVEERRRMHVLGWAVLQCILLLGASSLSTSTVRSSLLAAVPQLGVVAALALWTRMSPHVFLLLTEGLLAALMSYQAWIIDAGACHYREAPDIAKYAFVTVVGEQLFI